MKGAMADLAFKTIIDLRAAELRWKMPLEGARPFSYESIERGQHDLGPDDAPVLVICSRGPRAALAARFLQVDGVAAVGRPFQASRRSEPHETNATTNSAALAQKMGR